MRGIVGPMSETAAFLFDPDAVRRAEDPPEDTARLFWMFVVLVREHAVSYARYAALFSRTDLTFRRDVEKLRELGKRFGFGLTPRRRGEVRLAHFDDDPLERRKRARSEDVADVVLAVVDALGDIVARSLDGCVDVAGLSGDRFLRIGAPRLRAGSDAAVRYDAVRDAWRMHARVRFRYPTRDGRTQSERIVEPYLTTYNAGRYYLVGFDVRPRSGGWRQYALDRIAGPIVRAGTFSPRRVPDEYRGDDAVGLFKTGRSYDVTVAVSAAVEGAVAARSWQRDQRLARDPSGRRTITFTVFDVGEAVRWALGFGAEAEVLAPPEAVACARAIVGDLERRYRADSGSAASG